MGAPRVLISDGGWATWQHTVMCGQVANIGKRWTLGAAMKTRGLWAGTREEKEGTRGKEGKEERTRGRKEI